MADLAKRFPHNPILKPADIAPSIPGLKVECLLNPGAFRYRGRTGLIMRVAERPAQKADSVSTPVLDPQAPGGIRIVEYSRRDPKLVVTGPHLFTYDGQSYLTTLSHLRLAWSDDGERFTPDPAPTLLGDGPLESFGLEDCRVAKLGATYHLTYTIVSPAGVGVGLRTTRNFRTFTNHGMIIPPHNKDVAIFEEKIGGRFRCLHRPSGVGLGGNFIWVADSQDLTHWGGHQCIAYTRPGMWDEERIGAGAAPIRTAAGWLEIYHGADRTGRYCLGAMLLDLNDPARVLARSREPIMEPTAEYEKKGFYGNCIFTNGQVSDGDVVTVYYGASDTVICGARLAISEILATLR